MYKPDGILTGDFNEEIQRWQYEILRAF